MLKALDDPNRFIAAHCVLSELGKPRHLYFSGQHGKWRVLDWDGLPVRMQVGFAELGRPDFSFKNEVRKQWHQRLDRPAFTIRYAWLIAATLILPLAHAPLDQPTSRLVRNMRL